MINEPVATPTTEEIEQEKQSEVTIQSSAEKVMEVEPQVTNVYVLPEMQSSSYVYTVPGSSSGAGGSQSVPDVRGKSPLLEDLVDELEDVDVVDLKSR